MGKHVVVVGAGIGGLAAAIGLAGAGLQVTVLERAEAPGGKVYTTEVGGAAIDCGPTALTLRWALDELFAAAGTSLDAELTLGRATTLGRQSWAEDQVLDLHADPRATQDAIGAFAGAKEAAGFAAFQKEAGRLYAMLERPFLRAPRPGAADLMQSVGLHRAHRLRPFTTAWAALGSHFRDKRLQQLYGHGVAAAGTSPFLAPAAAIILPFIEQQHGIWLVEGGMGQLVAALVRLATRHGVTLRLGTHVKEIMVSRGRANGVRLQDGEIIPADAVVMNGEPTALATGLLGRGVTGATPQLKFPQRSLSAMTFATLAEVSGLDDARKAVFHSKDYKAEYELINSGRLPTEPTVTATMADRDGGTVPDGPARLLLSINAPPNGDRRAFSQVEIEQCVGGITALLARSGVHIKVAYPPLMAGPPMFQRLFPASGGALWGGAMLGHAGPLARPTNRTRLPGLYLAGGATHPGAGVALAALSGRAAAAAAAADLQPRRPLMARLLGKAPTP